MVDAKPPLWYRLIWSVAWPCVLLRYGIKSVRLPEYRHRLYERMGWVKRGKYEVMIHAASVGESKVALWLRSRLPKDQAILFSTTTPTGAMLIQQALGPNDHHVYWPWDVYGMVARFFRRASLNHLVLIESELWPEMITQAVRNGVNVWVVNGRLSTRSFHRYKRFPALVESMAKQIRQVFPEGKRSAYYFKKLGFSLLSDEGHCNLKYAADAPKVDEALRQSILRIKKGPMVVIASTHLAEEKLIYNAIRKHIPEALLVFIPRHPYRANDVVSEIDGAELFTVGMTDRSICWVVGALGQLGTWYSVADVVVMGGSYVSVGGHNPLEAGWFHAPVVVGPKVDNFVEMYTQLVEQRCVWPVKISKLGIWLKYLIQHPDLFSEKVFRFNCFVDLMRKKSAEIGSRLKNMLTIV